MARKQSAPKKIIIAKTENPESIEGELLDKLPKRERRIIKGMIFSGPLPPPDEFNKYPPEVQKAIVNDARAQMKHRHKIENKVVDSDSFAVKTGSFGTIAIYIICIIGTIFLFAIGKMIEGVMIGTATGIAKSLVLFRSNNNHSDSKELQKDNEKTSKPSKK